MGGGRVKSCSSTVVLGVVVRFQRAVTDEGRAVRDALMSEESSLGSLTVGNSEVPFFHDRFAPRRKAATGRCNKCDNRVFPVSCIEADIS